jgi:hypothetical protein
MFWAHSDPGGLAESAEGAHWQPLADHLRAVARLAEQLAQSAHPKDAQFHEEALWPGVTLCRAIGRWVGTDITILICLIMFDHLYPPIPIRVDPFSSAANNAVPGDNDNPQSPQQLP